MRPYPPDLLIFEDPGERTGVHSREPYSRGEEILLLRRHVGAELCSQSITLRVI